MGSPYVRSTMPPRRRAEHADAVAGAEEGEVGRDDPVGEVAQLGLGPALDGRLRVVGVGDVEGAAAEDDPRPVVEVDLTERVRSSRCRSSCRRSSRPAPASTASYSPPRDGVLRAGAEEEERTHGSGLGRGAARDQGVDVLDAPGLQGRAGVGAGAGGRHPRVEPYGRTAGAGAGWTTPSSSTKVPRAARWGWSAASLAG